MTRIDRWKSRLPDWAQDWLDIIIPGAQILLILAVAWLLQRLLRKLVARAAARYGLPHAMLMPINGAIRWIIFSSALLLSLERLGVSASVLWTAFTGFATVGAVAFFAAWSVLSNLFCALLILTVGPFRLGDTIELLDTAEKPGAKGRVVDINMLYTTLEDSSAPEGPPVLLQIPNALIFQRVLRRWRAGYLPPENTLKDTPAADTPAADTPAADAPAGTPAAAAAAPTA